MTIDWPLLSLTVNEQVNKEPLPAAAFQVFVVGSAWEKLVPNTGQLPRPVCVNVPV